MKRLKTIKYQSILILALLYSTMLNAQSTSSLHEAKDPVILSHTIFTKEEPLELTLKFDLKTFQQTKENEKYHPAKLLWSINDSTKEQYDVRIKSRGIFRKNYCFLPPFWLNLKNAGIDFEAGCEVKKMKVVTHCSRSKKFNDHILKEFLVYKMYNIISPVSYRVRLVKMKYIDTERDNKTIENWAFFIEPIELLTSRLNGELIENEKLAMKQMNAREMDQLAHFQYMIGNTDYSITGLHNIKIIQLDEQTPSGKIPIPYDFDFTGIVNTTYAIPRESLGKKDITERHFLGPCRSENIHQLAIDKLQLQKCELLELIESFEYLSLDPKLEMLKYIESYYTSASRDAFIRKNIEPTCR